MEFRAPSPEMGFMEVRAPSPEMDRLHGGPGALARNGRCAGRGRLDLHRLAPGEGARTSLAGAGRGRPALHRLAPGEGARTSIVLQRQPALQNAGVKPEKNRRAALLSAPFGIDYQQGQVFPPLPRRHAMREAERRPSYVDPAVQGAFLTRAVIYWLACVTCLAMMLLTTGMLSDPARTLDPYVGSYWFRLLPALVIALVLLPAMAFDMARLANRLASPLVRLRKVMRGAAQGQPMAPIRLREGDFWADFAEDLNLVLARLQEIEASHAARPDCGSADRKLVDAMHG